MERRERTDRRSIGGVIIGAGAVATGLLLLAGLPASAERCTNVACPGSPAACTTTVYVNVPTHNGNAVSLILGQALTANGGMMTAANCNAPFFNGNMGNLTFMATPTGPGASCLWQIRVKTVLLSGYFNVDTCQVDHAEDGLPVELLDFGIRDE